MDATQPLAIGQLHPRGIDPQPSINARTAESGGVGGRGEAYVKGERGEVRRAYMKGRLGGKGGVRERKTGLQGVVGE